MLSDQSFETRVPTPVLLSSCPTHTVLMAFSFHLANLLDVDEIFATTRVQNVRVFART